MAHLLQVDSADGAITWMLVRAVAVKRAPVWKGR